MVALQYWTWRRWLVMLLFAGAAVTVCVTVWTLGAEEEPRSPMTMSGLRFEEEQKVGGGIGDETGMETGATTTIPVGDGANGVGVVDGNVSPATTEAISTTPSTSPPSSSSTTTTTAPYKPPTHNSNNNNPIPLPAIHPLNGPPTYPPSTPLLIGFTRNFPILQQSLFSYISSGWPPSQIYIIDNTGTFQSNAHNLLTPSNPFHLPHTLLTETYGVNVLTTPTLLTFSQLQNFYTALAVERGWGRYFWSHMDAVVVSYEDRRPYKSVYASVLEVLRGVDREEREGKEGVEAVQKWALRFFSYDRLTLVNTQAVIDVGGWDTLIPYYYSDCDFYSRVRMEGYSIRDEDVGHVFDVGGVLPDLAMLFPNWAGESTVAGVGGGDVLVGVDGIDGIGGSDGDGDGDGDGQTEIQSHNHPPPITPQHHHVVALLTEMMEEKNTASGGRNYWQLEQKGGKGEPFYRPAKAFDEEVGRLIALGREVYARKWGFKIEEGEEAECDLQGSGRGLQDMWSGVGE